MEDLKKSYINAMRSVTSTVSIISAKEDGERHAMTATSVTSLSLDPPAMLVCVNKDASIHNIINYGPVIDNVMYRSIFVNTNQHSRRI